MKKILNKKVIIFLLVLVFFVLNFSFATWNVSWSTWNSSGSSLSFFLVSLADFIWTIWFIFPIIAGKLLTNDFVYGSLFHFDVVLWNIWNFSRTLANFIIWFTFIYLIIKYILSYSEKEASILKTWLPKIAISAVLVNMSWFLIWVLIDISTILIAWFGSMAADISQTPTLVVPTKTEIWVQKCNPEKDKSCIKWMLQAHVVDKQWLDLKKIETYETTISWPLLFLWTSILWITNFKNKILNEAYDFQAKKFKHWWVAIKAIVQIFLFIMFIIPIIILAITNMIRIFWLWIYIWFSPLLFLDWVWGKNHLGKVNKAFAFKNVIWLIFSPALVVLAFSISIILVLWIVDALNVSEWTNKYEKQVKKTFLLGDSQNGVLVIDYGKWQDAWHEMSKYIWGFFWYLISVILIVLFIWAIMKMSFKASEVTSGVAQKMFDFSEDLFKTIPMPTPFGSISAWSLKMVWSKINAIPDTMISKQSEELDRMFNLEPDTDPKKLQAIIDWFANSSSAAKQDYNKALDDALSEIERFKWRREIKKATNTKKVIDTLIKEMSNRQKSNTSLWLSNILRDLQKATNYSEKVDIINKNITTIKNALHK